MGKVWSTIIIGAILYGVVTGRGDELARILLEIPMEGFNLSLTLVTAACFWSGFMYIMLEVGMIDVIARWLRPALRIMFPKLEDKIALNYISANIAANMFGLGFAATPSGLKGIKRLQEISPLPKDVASDEMIKFLVLNTSGVTIIPTTIIAIRQATGATNPTDFLIFGLMATTISTVFGLIFERIYWRPYVG